MAAPKEYARLCLSTAVIYKDGWNTTSIVYRFCVQTTTQDKLNDCLICLSHFQPVLLNHKPQKYFETLCLSSSEAKYREKEASCN